MQAPDDGSIPFLTASRALEVFVDYRNLLNCSDNASFPFRHRLCTPWGSPLSHPPSVCSFLTYWQLKMYNTSRQKQQKLKETQGHTWKQSNGNALPRLMMKWLTVAKAIFCALQTSSLSLNLRVSWLLCPCFITSKAGLAFFQMCVFSTEIQFYSAVLV